jgi:hypothetical protein
MGLPAQMVNVKGRYRQFHADYQKVQIQSGSLIDISDIDWAVISGRLPAAQSEY